MCFAAEIGLAGEVRPVTRVEQRLTEAAKLGLKHCNFFLQQISQERLWDTHHPTREST